VNKIVHFDVPDIFCKNWNYVCDLWTMCLVLRNWKYHVLPCPHHSHIIAWSNSELFQFVDFHIPMRAMWIKLWFWKPWTQWDGTNVVE